MPDSLTLTASITAQQDAANPGGRIAHSIAPHLHSLQSHLLAVFVETTGSVTIDLNSGVMRRNAVATTRSEQGAGRTFTQVNGYIIIVEPNDPAVASSGYVTIQRTMRGVSYSAAQAFEDGLDICLQKTAFASNAASFTLDFTNAVNKKATLIMVGKA